MHIRFANVGIEGSILHFEGGMNFALFIDDNHHVLNWPIEEIMSFNKFKALIHHGIAIDGNLWSHLPSRMVQGKSRSDILKFITCHITEGATACGHDET